MEKKADFKTMSKKKIIEHIWEYYRWHIIVSIAVVAGLSSLIYHFATYVEPSFNVVMLNCYNALNDNSNSAFEPFLEQQGIDVPAKDAVELNSNLYFLEDDSEGTNYMYLQKLIALVAAGGQDVFLGNGEIFSAYTREGALMDLSTVFSEEFLENYELVYTTDAGTSEKYPCAITIRENKWLTDNGYYFSDHCNIGIFENNAHLDTAIAFVEYMLTYE